MAEADVITDPTRLVYLAGRNVGTLYPWVVPLIRIFRCQPTAWLLPWEVDAWGILSDAEAVKWFLLGAESPYPDGKPLPFHAETVVTAGA